VYFVVCDIFLKMSMLQVQLTACLHMQRLILELCVDSTGTLHPLTDLFC